MGRSTLFCVAAKLFCGEGDTLFENVKSDVGLVLINDQRRTQADAGFAAAEDEQAAFEGEVDDFVAHGPDRCTGFLIFDDLDTDHQAAAADVTDVRELLDPGA